MTESEATKAGPHVTHYTVNDEPQETTEHQLSARQILIQAGINPDENYLVQIEGRKQTPYKENPDDLIRLHENQAFVSIFTGIVPVS